MMDDHSLPIGTIRGIKLRLHWTWGIIFLLIAWSLAVSIFPNAFNASNPAEYWLLGAAGAILLFVTVLIHELSHSLVARAEGLPVDSITLYLLGGVSQLKREPDSARTEFWMTFAGPLASLVLGAIFLGVRFSVPLPDWLGALFAYLGEINILLALFNLVPAFPLDGGRVLRSIAWGATRDRARATALALGVSRWIAWSFIVFGIWTIFVGGFIAGLWLVFIGWFVQTSAVSYRAAEDTQRLQVLRVADGMTTRPVTVTPDLRLDTAVQDYLLHQDERALPVVSEGRLLGLLSITDIQRMPSEQWSVISVWRAMTPVDHLDTVTPNSRLVDALRLMSEHRRNEIPVVVDGRLAGLLSRSKAQHYLQVRRDLGLDSDKPPPAPSGRMTAA